MRHLTQNIPTCWYILALPNAKIGVTPDAKPKIGVTPDASLWNIGGVGPSGIGAGVGHVHFRLFVSISLGLVANANAVFRGIWALKCMEIRE